MFIKSIRFPLIYFVVLTSGQLLANKEVNWGDNIGVFFAMLLIIGLYNWVKATYKQLTDK